jgi:hypothetical protein
MLELFIGYLIIALICFIVLLIKGEGFWQALKGALSLGLLVIIGLVLAGFLGSFFQGGI